MYYARLGSSASCLERMQNSQIVCEFSEERPGWKRSVKEEIVQWMHTSSDGACGWEVPGDSDKYGDDFLAKKLLGGP
jgi:hypothetical protein